MDIPGPIFSLAGSCRSFAASLALHLLFSVVTLGFWQLVVSFLYNKQYMGRLITAGFKFADQPQVNAEAAAAVGADLALSSVAPVN